MSNFIYLSPSSPLYYTTTSIIPNSIHPKPLLPNLQPGDPRQVFLMPPVNLDTPLLIIRERKPLIAPRTRAHSIRVPTTRRRRIEKNLALNRTHVANFERRDVAGEGWRVGARGREEVLAGRREKDDVGPVHGRIGDIWVTHDLSVSVSEP